MESNKLLEKGFNNSKTLTFLMLKKKNIKKIKRKTARIKSKVKRVKPKVSKVKKTKINLKKKVSQKVIGEVIHFYDQISVAVVKLKDNLNQGEQIKIEGHGKSFIQKVGSMQMDHKSIKTGKNGQEIGLKLNKPVRRKYLVYKA